MSVDHIVQMLGVVLVEISGAENGSDEIRMKATDGRTFRFYHEQNCCERVSVEDIVGDVSDLIGNPLVIAEEVSNEPPAPDSDSYESETWTFYRFATVKGTVTVRWLGRSNGYYSEHVDFEVMS